MWTRARALAALLAVVTALAVLLRRYPTDALDLSARRSTIITDRHGVELYERRSRVGSYGHPVELDRVSPALVQATLAGEDAFFYRHPGIDPSAVVRALWLDLNAGQLVYGGSTITQQLAKSLDRQPRTLWGKTLEALDAIRLERTLTKREILEQYLNRVCYGRLACGAEAAAERFFGKHANELSLDEAALLAILPRSPGYYDPARHPERARARRAHVLSLMVERGFITREQADDAAKMPIRLVDPRGERMAPHLLDQLERRGELTEAPDYLVTTIDLELQKQSLTRLRAHLERVRDRGATQGGVVVIDNTTREVLVLIGSSDYARAATNVAFAPRPPGSALKPFIYALALEAGLDPKGTLLDTPVSWKNYAPRSADGQYHGAVPVKTALGSSLNLPAVKLAERVGPARVVALLDELGVVDGSSLTPGLAVALGGVPVRLIDLANAYATLASSGMHGNWRLTAGPSGPRRRVLGDREARVITGMLSDASARRMSFGVDTPLDLEFPVAAKSGTSQSFCDNVVIGYTAEFTVAVWVGNFDGSPMRGLLAMEGAAPLWRDVMEVAMRGRRPRPLPMHAVGVSHGASGFADLLRVVSPAAGGEYVLDPLLPVAQQKLAFRAEVAREQRLGGARVRWLIDGTSHAEVGAPYEHFAMPERGEHRVAAVLVSKSGEELARSDPIAFSVEGDDS